MPNRIKLDFDSQLRPHYVAFLDVMGFSDIVGKGNTVELKEYFEKIVETLANLKRDKANIKSMLISDSIILVAPDDFSQFIQLLWAVRRIQGALLLKRILLRGAISFGDVYFNEEHNIIVGKGFIRAYHLEALAVYPRVILDPAIVKKNSKTRKAFLERVNSDAVRNPEARHIYSTNEFTKINDDAIFVEYANKVVKSNEIERSLERIHQHIKDNLYGDQRLYSKYIWLKDYFLETLELQHHRTTVVDEESRKYKAEINKWIELFEEL